MSRYFLKQRGCAMKKILLVFILFVIPFQSLCFSQEKEREIYSNYPDRKDWAPISITSDGTNLIVLFVDRDPSVTAWAEDLIVFYDKKTSKVVNKFWGPSPPLKP